MRILSWACAGALLVACNNGGKPADGGGDTRVDTTPPTDGTVPSDAPNDHASDGSDAQDVTIPTDVNDVVPMPDVAPDTDAVADATDAGGVDVVDVADVGVIPEGGMLVPTSAPCGAVAVADPTLPAGVVPAIDLGHTQGLDLHMQSGDRILAREGYWDPSMDLARAHWVLWDAVHRTQIASGLEVCPTGYSCPPMELRGSTLALGTSTGMILRAASDGHVIATLTVSAPYGLAVDGSYAWGMTPTGLTAWSTTTGAMLFSQPVSYVPGGIFAAPGEFRIVASASGGGSTLTHINLATGTSTTPVAQQGTLPVWWLDGSHVLLMPGPGSGSAGWIYGADGTLAQFVTYTTPFGFGLGNYYWSASRALTQIGSTTPAITGSLTGVGGNQIAYSDSSGGSYTLHIVTVGATGLTTTDVPDQVWVYRPSDNMVTPYNIYGSFGGDSAGNWSIGTSTGLLYDHRALTQSLSCGAVQAIGASANGYLGVVMTSGIVAIVDARSAVPVVIGYVPTGARPDMQWSDYGAGVQWSDDGSVMLVDSGQPSGAAGYIPRETGSETLTAYSMPGAVPLSSPFTTAMFVKLYAALSGDGHSVAMSICGTDTCERRVTNLAGTDRLGVAPVPGAGARPAISTDGTMTAFGPYTAAIYTGTTQTGTPTMMFWPVGWTDDAHLLAVEGSLGFGSFSPTAAVLSLGPAGLGAGTLVPGNRVWSPSVVGGELDDATSGARVWVPSMTASGPPLPYRANPVFPVGLTSARAGYWIDYRVVIETLP